MNKLKNKNIKKILISLMFVFTIVCIVVFGTSNVFAATVLKSYNFSGSASAFGGKFQTFDYLEGRAADYVKVNIRANNGDNYDLRFVYTSTFPSERKVLAEKKGITAKGSNNTFYFISKNGSCPGSSSQCIRVPVIDRISTADNAVSFYDVMYGIEIYNGSFFGGTLNVSGTYSFMNY